MAPILQHTQIVLQWMTYGVQAKILVPPGTRGSISFSAVDGAARTIDSIPCLNIDTERTSHRLPEPGRRGLHSSTFQLNLSRFLTHNTP